MIKTYFRFWTCDNGVFEKGYRAYTGGKEVGE